MSNMTISAVGHLESVDDTLRELCTSIELMRVGMRASPMANT